MQLKPSAVTTLCIMQRTTAGRHQKGAHSF